MNEPLIQTFGLFCESDYFTKIKPTKKCTIIDTDRISDLIAINCICIVVNADKASINDIQLLFDYYTEISFPAEKVILIGEVSIPNKLVRIITRYDTIDIAKEHLKYDFLDAFQQCKKNESFSNTVTNALVILKQIRAKPGVTTQELSERLELSPRTIQRYIESLRVAGEWIEYDRTIKGWKLSVGKSVLYGDFDNQNKYEEK